jgi:hypothetical protein
MVRRRRKTLMHRPVGQAWIADVAAAATGETSPKAVSEYGRLSCPGHIPVPETEHRNNQRL